MVLKNIAAIYANLVMRGIRTEESIPNAEDRTHTMIIVCARHIYETRTITFAAACGEEPDASDPLYKNHKYNGFCKDNNEFKQAVANYCISKGYSSLVKTIIE